MHGEGLTLHDAHFTNVGHAYLLLALSQRIMQLDTISLYYYRDFYFWLMAIYAMTLCEETKLVMNCIRSLASKLCSDCLALKTKPPDGP
ncbi:Uncharacterized protein TCM_010273 [Theobroma cacao]|uniref:Uncharacterized protein n=1 Tax=Theobroma cacao TaxID=3641 RepID=A0A061E7Q7_THECC|nr:Uncharacterized protein TCM_010273 [Theobroma cacao]